jgi:hypothetical protein
LVLGRVTMYVSRLAFHTIPGKTSEVEQELRNLRSLVAAGGGQRSRILRAHFASLGAPDLVFEQEATDLADLERQLKGVTENPDFQQWSKRVSSLLAQSPKREVYLVGE